MDGNVSNLAKDTIVQVQKAEWTTNKINLKKSKRYIIIKHENENKKTSKVAGEKWHITRGEHNLNDSRFSSETMRARKRWHNIFKCWKKRTIHCKFYTPPNYLAGMKEK